MNKSEYSQIVRETPIFRAIFRVTKVPKWVPPSEMQIGDEVADIGRSFYVFRSQFRPILTTEEMEGISPEHLEFVEYRNCSKIRRYIL